MYDGVIFTDVNETLGYAKYAGAYRIASALRNLNANIKVIDFFVRLSEDEIYFLIKKFVSKQTKFVGIASTLLQRPKNLHGFDSKTFGRIKANIKDQNPNCDLIIGGSRVGLNTRLDGVDFYFIGKADISIVEYYKYKIGEENSLKITKNNDRNYVNTTDHNVSSDFFKTTTITYNIDDTIFYNEALPIEISRGCIFKCSFCQYDLIGKKKWEYLKDPAVLRDELIRNYELFGTTTYLFSDDIINESIEKVTYLHKVLTSLPFKISWNSYARLDMFWAYPEMREMIEEMGAAALYFGIETLDEKAGKTVGKGLGKDRTFSTLDFLKEKYDKKIVMASNFILGLPHETEQSLYNTFNWLSSDECPINAFSFTPLNLRTAKDGRPLNDIALNPSKFGYNSDTIKDDMIIWENEHLTWHRAFEIHNEFYGNENFYHKNLSGSSWVGRITNLDITLDEVKSLIFKKKTFTESKEISNRWINLTNKKLVDYKRLLGLS
jgi:radical SAM superfamily enzyme YgiQ (UPF0313 family)